MLKVESITVHNNFIELGGDSLGATQLLAVIRGRFGVEIPARLLFEGTLGELARAVER
jgi:acyl carrier protein